MNYQAKSGKLSKKNSNPQKAWKQYKLSMVGDAPLRNFILYEFLTVFITPLPWEIGIKLRQLVFASILDELGSGVKLEQNITFRRPKQITIGDEVIIGKGSVVDVKTENGKIELKNNVSIGQKTIINCIDGNLSVGVNTKIGDHVRLGSLKGLAIGQNCVIGDYSYLSGAAHEYSNSKLPIIEQPLTCRGKTSIGDHVIIGENVTINDGVHIGSHAQIASGSFVNTDIPSKAYATGVPAKFYLKDIEHRHE